MQCYHAFLLTEFGILINAEAKIVVITVVYLFWQLRLHMHFFGGFAYCLLNSAHNWRFRLWQWVSQTRRSPR
jgi:hypothetical protein